MDNDRNPLLRNIALGERFNKGDQRSDFRSWVRKMGKAGSRISEQAPSLPDPPHTPNTL